MRLEAVLAVFKWFTGPAETRTPECTVLPDGRKRLVRFFAIADAGTQPPCLAWEFGSLDATTAPTGWENLRLVGKKVDEMPRGRDNRPVAILTYETLNATTETAVGEWTQVRLEDGRTAWEKQWLILATATYAPATVGASYTVPTGTAYLQKEEAANDGLLRRITRTCITAGTLEIDTQTRNNGALVIKRITSVVTVPTTPTGYVLIGEPVQNINGVPVYTYTFVKGAGLVSEQRDLIGDGITRVTWVSLGTRLVPSGHELPGSSTVEEDGYQRHTATSLQWISGAGETPLGEWKRVRLDDGRDAWSREWIQLLTESASPATVGAEYTVPAGTAYLQREETAPDAEIGFRRITRTCITAGILSTRTQTKAGGKIMVKTITAAKTVPSTPEGYTLIDAPVQNSGGLPVYTYTYVKGSGVIEKETRELGDGLLRVTWTSLGTKEVPPGIEMNDSTESEEDGYKRYRTVCIQHLDGLTPVGKTFTYQTMIPWTYPGRAHPYATTVDGSPRVLINVFYSPPVETEVVGTVNVTYSTTATMSAPGNLWQPTDWATVYAKFLGSGGHPTAKVETIRGYRKTGTTNAEVTGAGTSGVDDPGGTCLGYNVYGNSTASIVVAGGPANPDGQTYTIRFEHRPDFVAADGTQYYKTTAITATIPAQPALPDSF